MIGGPPGHERGKTEGPEVLTIAIGLRTNRSGSCRPERATITAGESGTFCGTSNLNPDGRSSGGRLFHQWAASTMPQRRTSRAGSSGSRGHRKLAQESAEVPDSLSLPAGEGQAVRFPGCFRDGSQPLNR